jgi:hypothetical protein
MPVKEKEVKVGMRIWYSRHPGKSIPGSVVNGGVIIRTTPTQIVVKSDRGHELKFRKRDWRKVGCGSIDRWWMHTTPDGGR